MKITIHHGYGTMHGLSALMLEEINTRLAARGQQAYKYGDTMPRDCPELADVIALLGEEASSDDEGFEVIEIPDGAYWFIEQGELGGEDLYWSMSPMYEIGRHGASIAVDRGLLSPQPPAPSPQPTTPSPQPTAHSPQPTETFPRKNA